MTMHNREWTESDFKQAKPFREIFPRQHAAWKKRTREPAQRREQSRREVDK